MTKWPGGFWAAFAAGLLLSGGTALADNAIETPWQHAGAPSAVVLVQNVEYADPAIDQENSVPTPFEEEAAGDSPADDPNAPATAEAEDSVATAEAADSVATAEAADSVATAEATDELPPPGELPDDLTGMGFSADSDCEPGCDGDGDCGGGKRAECGGFRFGGWLAQGVTTNARTPHGRFHGPVTFNDRDAEWQMNQLWLFAEHELDTSGGGWDIGGRVDLLFGTDHRFTQARGLETHGDGSDRWNSRRFYGLAMPQAYVDVGSGDFSLRMGHFFTIIGHEVVAAPDNFFYSHAYTMQYGEPFTHSGILAGYAVSDLLSVSAGFGRGWDNWEDNNNELSFLGGVTASSHDGNTTLAFALSSGSEDDYGSFNRNMYSIVLTHQCTENLRYVLQHDYGVDENGFLGPGAIIDSAEWHGINQYLIYDLNACWSFGLRFEWFRDADGARVGGLGSPHGWTLGPDPDINQRGWVGDFFALTAGINWKPTECITVRPECRWDWYDGGPSGGGYLPYDYGGSDDQFTFGTDVIWTF